MTEGGLNAPTRHPIAWEDPDFLELIANLRQPIPWAVRGAAS